MNYLITLFCAILFFGQAHAIETEVKGFMALDLFEFYKKEGTDPYLTSGIGTLDIKFYAYHDNMSFKLKLDLDNSEINQAYNLFEEANATYRITETLKVTAGKGLVPFNQKRYGVLESAYLDGGSPIGGSNSWRDPDNKLLIIMGIGGFKQGYLNQFTFYGDSKQIETNSDGTLKVDTKGNLTYKTSKDFKTKDQRGFANKLEFFIGDLSIYGSGIFYHNDYYPMDSWALDTGSRYKTADLEIWFEAIYGFYSTHSGAKYPAFRQWEKLVQLGAEKKLNEHYAFAINLEGMIVKKHTWQSTMFEDHHIKIDLGPKYIIRENAFLTTGLIAERKKSYQNSNYKETKHLLGTGLKLSFWY